VRLKFKMSPYTKETVKILLLFVIYMAPLIYFRNYLENRGLLFVFGFSIVLGIIYILIGFGLLRIKFIKDIVILIKRKIKRK